MPHHLAATEAAVTAAAQKQLLMEKFKIELQRYNLPGMPPLPAGFPSLPTNGDMAGYPFNLPVPPFHATPASQPGLPHPPLMQSVSPAPSTSNTTSASARPPHLLSPNNMLFQQQQSAAVLKSMMNALPPGTNLNESAEFMRMLAAAASTGGPLPGMPNPLSNMRNSISNKQTSSPTLAQQQSRSDLKKDNSERLRESDEFSEGKRLKKARLESPSQSSVPIAITREERPVEIQTVEANSPTRQQADPIEIRSQDGDDVVVEDEEEENAAVKSVPNETTGPADEKEEEINEVESQIESNENKENLIDDDKSADDTATNDLVIAEREEEESCEPSVEQKEASNEPSRLEVEETSEPAPLESNLEPISDQEDELEQPIESSKESESAGINRDDEETYDESTNELHVDETKKFEEEATRTENIGLS